MINQKIDLWTILYRSKTHADDLEIIDIVSEILAVSARNNLRDTISGLLVYDEGAFFQVLEGPQDTVQACYQRILEDTRHFDIEKMSDERIDRRKFSRWSMGYMDTYELDDYGALSSLLNSEAPRDIYRAMVRIGSEHGLIQRATG